MHVRTILTLPAALAVCAIGLPAGVATATSQDLRSPDARDSAPAVVPSTPQDLRSPDARDSAPGVAASTGLMQDLRSPDARSPMPISAPVPAVRVSTSDGFDLGSAAIGAGVLALLLLTAAAGIPAMRNHARGRLAA